MASFKSRRGRPPGPRPCCDIGPGRYLDALPGPGLALFLPLGLHFASCWPQDVWAATCSWSQTELPVMTVVGFLPDFPGTQVLEEGDSDAAWLFLPSGGERKCTGG